jgi:hypothetical protein
MDERTRSDQQSNKHMQTSYEMKRLQDLQPQDMQHAKLSGIPSTRKMASE